MYNLLVTVAVMAVIMVALKFGVALPLWVSVVVSLLIALGVFLLIARYVLKKVTAIVEGAVKDLQAQRIEKGIRELKAAFKYGKWQFYVTGQLNSQIGMIYYMKRDFSNAFPYLEKSFFKNWVAMGMLGVTYLKRNKKDKMIQTFENTVRWTGKESLLWALYAYCLCEAGDKGKAVEVLTRGLKKLPGDEKLSQNLELLNEGKKMKMKAYGEMWLQFHLEGIGTIQKQQMAAMGGAKRRIMRK